MPQVGEVEGDDGLVRVLNGKTKSVVLSSPLSIFCSTSEQHVIELCWRD